MGRLRQLPQLYLRGAIANETMRHMRPETRTKIEDLTIKLCGSPMLAGHKQEFIRKLGQTIGGDYREDRGSAEQEFTVAVWRALTYLVDHSDYRYRCAACKADSYLTQRGRPTAIDRRSYDACPACQAVCVVVPGNTPNLKAEQIISGTAAQELRLQGYSFETRSPIQAKRGEHKVADHEAVLADDSQLFKFMGEFIWNYFRQHLRENEIRYHAKEEKKVAGPADQVAVEEALSILARAKYPHNYQTAGNPRDGCYRIISDMRVAGPRIIYSVAALTARYKATYGVDVVVDDQGIAIRTLADAPTAKAFVVKPQVVSVLTGSTCIQTDQDDSESVLDTNYHKIVRTGSKPTMHEDGVAAIDSSDLLDAIRESLPEGAQAVWDIYAQNGETYQRFERHLVPNTTTVSVQTNPEKPRESHIARFLGVSPNQIKTWISDIRLRCLAHGVGAS